MLLELLELERMMELLLLLEQGRHGLLSQPRHQRQ
jgi:hypothetical protein